MERTPVVRDEFVFASRPSPVPGLSNNLKRVQVVSNNLIVNFNQVNKKCYEYNIEFIGINFNENDQRRAAIKKLEPELRKCFAPYKFAGNNFFSLKNYEEDIIIKTVILDQEVEARIRNTKHFIDLSKVYTDQNIKKDIKCFMENLIKNIIKANNKMIRLNYTNYYDLNTMKSISDNAYSINGFSTSFRSTDTGFYLLVNVKNKFLNKMDCYEKLKQIRSENPRDFRREAENFFSGLIVLTTYGTPRTYTLKGINFDATVSNRTIRIHQTGEEITLKQYYEQNYPEMRINVKEQPLLVVEQKRSDGTVEEIFLVPELCKLTGIDDKAAADIRNNMARSARPRPNEKMKSIEGFMKLINNKESKKKKNNITGTEREFDCPAKIKEEWGLGFSGFKTLNAKVLPPPEVEFNGQRKIKVEKKIQYQELIEKENLNRRNWKIIVDQKNFSAAEKLYENLCKCSGRMGITVEKPEIERLTSKSAEGFINEMRNMKLNNELKIVVIILDRFTESHYKQIKYYLNTEVGTPSQVVKMENLSKNLSYFTNVLCQMIVKMGGRLFKINFLNEIYKKPTVFMGIQIEKMGASSKKIIITCTYDRSFSKYYTNERISPTEEVSTNIVNLITNAFNYFRTIYNISPQRAFIYRSGVSDEEKKIVFVQEIQAIERYFETLGNNVEYVFTVVNKKTDMKFFTIEGNGKDLNNPQDGTVIDDTVTAFGQYEFYLQNQFVNQGCATPTHYHVLKCTFNIPQEALQEITYHMSYYYWNWSGPIRLPACLKFAETYCKFIGTTNGNHGNLDIMERLRNKPYYI